MSPPTTAIRVLVADDHALMREGLRIVLEREQGIQVIAEAEDLSDVLAQARAQRPGVLVLDLGMNDNPAISTIRLLTERLPDTRIVALSMQDRAVFAQRALADGALAFVAKELADEELPQAVRAAARDEHYISPRIAARLAELDRALTEERLTSQEIELLRLIALGYTRVELGKLLNVAPRVLDGRRSQILSKLGLSTRAELVRYALRRGLLRG